LPAVGYPTLLKMNITDLRCSAAWAEGALEIETSFFRALGSKKDVST